MTFFNGQFEQIGMNKRMVELLQHLKSIEDIGFTSLILFGFHLILLGFLAF